MRTNNIIALLLVFILICSCTGQSDNSKKPTPPNIILFLSEGLGYSDVGYFGSEINTPNLDRMAEKGLVMTQFYNAAGYCQSRASLLTGLYPRQTGRIDLVSDPGSSACQWELNFQCVTLAEVLKGVGYTTILAGFCHPGIDSASPFLNRGFDRYFGLPDSANYMTDACTDKALEYVNSYSSEGKPFFIFITYRLTGSPQQALPEDIEKYKGKYDEGWEKIRDNRFLKMINNGIMAMDESISPLDQNVPVWDKLSAMEKKKWTDSMECYAAMIDRMDQGVGEILKALEKSGIINNTLIIFLSDNGGRSESAVDQTETYVADTVQAGKDNFPCPNISDTPFFKQFTNEGGISSPFIAFWPDGIDEASESNHLAHMIDIMPTIVEVSGATYPEKLKANKILPMEGISLAPLFSGDEPEYHEFLIWEQEGSRALRMEDYKIVSNKTDKGWQIYDIDSDRCEQENLSEDMPQEVKAMKKIYKREAERLGIYD